MPRQILQICPHDSAPFGDLCRRYVQAAASIDIATTSVYLAPPEKQPLAYAEYLGFDNLADTAALRKALAPYGEHHWDMVLCHRYRPYWAVARSPLAQYPCVVLAHEFGLMDRWQRRLARQLFARQFKFTGVSPAVAAQLSRSVGRAGVLPNVLDPQHDPALVDKSQALSALGLEPGPFTIGLVGRLHYKKRPDLAVQAFQVFRQSHPEARLVVLGAGDRNELTPKGQSAPDMSAPDMGGVHLMGVVPGAAKLFSAFDVLLHTAELEPFVMVVLEAMAAGVPVVTRRAGGPEYVLGDLGVYAAQPTAVAFAEALEKVLTLDRETYQNAGRHRIQDYFSIEALAKALEHLLIDFNQAPSG